MLRSPLCPSTRQVVGGRAALRARDEGHGRDHPFTVDIAQQKKDVRRRAAALPLSREVRWRVVPPLLCPFSSPSRRLARRREERNSAMARDALAVVSSSSAAEDRREKSCSRSTSESSRLAARSFAALPSIRPVYGAAWGTRTTAATRRQPSCTAEIEDGRRAAALPPVRKVRWLW